MIGTILDEKYRIDRLLGRGGMGSVLAAQDLRSGESVAIKVIHAELPGRAPDIAERFAREARAAGSIDTEHIARCLDSGIDGATGQPYMVLEHLEGEDLHRVLKRTGPIDPDLALRVIAQACVGLSCAHEANVVHRDIKPANIFLARRRGAADEGDPERVVKLLDFGIAKIRRGADENMTDSDALTRTGSMLGSPMYMSPEQARSVRNVDHRADIWSLGVVLYQAVAGRTPFEHIGGLGDLVLALWSEAPPPVQQFAPWVQPEVAAILDRLLRVDATERFQSAAEVLHAVTPLLRDGREIRESMLIPVPDEVRDRPAATFFRRLDTRPRAFERPRTDPAPASQVSGPRSLQTGPRAQLAALSPANEGTSPLATTGDSSAGAPARAVSSPSIPGTNELSAAPVVGAQSSLTTTNVGLSASAPGVTGTTGSTGATGSTGTSSSAPVAGVSSGRSRAAGVAVLGLALGAGAVFWVLSSPGQGPSSTAPAASSALIAAPVEPTKAEPAVAPVGSLTADFPATSGAPAQSAPQATASSPASAVPSASASATVPGVPAKPTGVMPTARPRPSAAPAASVTAATTVKPGFTDFGDRK